MNKNEILSEIKGFLDGYNNELKYLVNVETDPSINLADCVIHEPNSDPKIIKVRYEPFMYMKDLPKFGYELYSGYSKEYVESKKIKYGITIVKQETGNQKRLEYGYCYKITSIRSFNDIVSYLKDGGVDPYKKLYDKSTGKVVKDRRGKLVYLHKDLFYSPRLVEQFFISTKSRLFKGYERYDEIHKVTFDIETTGLRHEISRVFAIGVRNNKGFEMILEVDKPNDDESEIRLIQDFFNLLHYLKPAIISGYNSEMFDFEFILGRVEKLGMNIDNIPTTLSDKHNLKRKSGISVKYGSTADKYTATQMWGISVIDILHAVKKTVAVNSDLKESKLKYVAKYEKIAKPNRTYIKGEDNSIGKFYLEDNLFLINELNEYVQIPNDYQNVAVKLMELQTKKMVLTDDEYRVLRNSYLGINQYFVEWFKNVAQPKNMFKFIRGKDLVKQYLLDDSWETEQIDGLYNQSSFMLAKIVPTTYQRICTMGTAAIWNLLMLAWSYENNIAIPHCDEYRKFSGGLTRCYKQGYSKRIVKIDYASLYPMIQLTEGVFPIFDITGVMKKMLLYLTTTRNIFKKMANGDKLNDEEVTLLKEIDSDVHHKYVVGSLSIEDIAMFKIKQLPIKILNNSLFGALGSGISFNWSDNDCASRITCTGRLHLRHAVSWFKKYGCTPLLAVTDGINFQIPEKTKIRVTDSGVFYEEIEQSIDEMWKYGGKSGISALILKYNADEMKPPFMSVDHDGESIACLNLSRINYATLSLFKDKKTGEVKEKIKLTGNTIKSKVMPEYIEEFIDSGLKLILHGKGKEFVEYYKNYVYDIWYYKIPLKKIANKSKIKSTINAYRKRGKDKNGREKGMQAHMELLIEERENIAMELFEKHKNEIDLSKYKKKEPTIKDILNLVSVYMPPEPELDSVVYYVNAGYKKSQGDSKKIMDKKTSKLRYCAKLINGSDLLNNPNMTGEYNREKYLDGFNKRVATLLVGFDPEIRNKILIKSNKKEELVVNEFTNDQLTLKNYDNDDFIDSMNLETLEVDFWNRSGYDPRLVWSGFTESVDYKIHYEYYENALKYLNDVMVKNNKPIIKSVNDNYGAGDYVLIKNGSEYHIGYCDGICIKIAKTNVDIPKTSDEIELNKIIEENEKKVSKDEQMDGSTELSANEVNEEIERKARNSAFILFKEKNGIPMEYTLEKMFITIDNSFEVFEDFYYEMHKNEPKEDECLTVDDGEM